MTFIDSEYCNPLADMLCHVLDIPDDTGGIPLRNFRYGTCHGLWRNADDAIEVVAVTNDKPGNGCFAKLMIELGRMAGATRVVRFREMLNDGLTKHLVAKWGFRCVGRNCEGRVRTARRSARPCPSTAASPSHGRIGMPPS